MQVVDERVSDSSRPRRELTSRLGDGFDPGRRNGNLDNKGDSHGEEAFGYDIKDDSQGPGS